MAPLFGDRSVPQVITESVDTVKGGSKSANPMHPLALFVALFENEATSTEIHFG